MSVTTATKGRWYHELLQGCLKALLSRFSGVEAVHLRARYAASLQEPDDVLFPSLAVRIQTRCSTSYPSADPVKSGPL